MTEHLTAADLPADPFELFAVWLREAREAGIEDASAMTLASANRDGRPSARTVLMRGTEGGAFMFHTNRTSLKGRDLAENSAVALVFHWRELRRQVCVAGTAAPATDEQSDDYFAHRPREAQIGAWASEQGAVLPGRDDLMRSVAAQEERFAGDEAIPRPPHWGGYRVAPDSIEFWRQREHRLHDRFAYLLGGSGWEIVRLSP